MAYDERTAERIRQILADRANVEEKRMVGGRSFLIGGHLCLGVTSEGLMVRVGPDEYAAALKLRHVRRMEFRGKPLIGYVIVEPAGFRTEAALTRWIQRGIDFVAALGVKADSGDAGSVAFRHLMQRLLQERGVHQGTGFGSNPGLRVGTKIFAMLARDGLVVRLPRARVDELVASGAGTRFDPRRDGRLMKEWVVVSVERRRLWGGLSDEALAFVRGVAGKGRVRVG
ncbi:MAG TPA: TfoX/Sxy family protein [Actinomycetota bacterium]|nr:TfoX/Sxy family protein [Actinomycetota bacterium]